MEIHIVVKGDTLWKIARQYGVPFEELKRINAHLANPDYIVPGMKIFLPAGTLTKGKKEPKESVKVPVKAKEKEIPKTPKVEEKVPVKQPSMPTPVMPPAVTAPSSPTSYPMPTVISPIIGIPCGWMPIYDADCYPCMPPASMQVEPAQESHHWMPAPVPVVPPTMPSMVEEEEESPILPPPKEAVPVQTMPDGWQLQDESPNLPEFTGAIGEMATTPYAAPAFSSYHPMPIQYPMYFIHWGCHCHNMPPMGYPMYAEQGGFGYPQAPMPMMPMMPTPEQRLDWNVSNS